ncbi:hypothetical protein DL93DRAFT_2166898 [Clavulina sp. PMI_390]|nr:hypothetical protein DL93DRAFT_2166898 [Clavulina sp. PMI_390]
METWNLIILINEPRIKGFWAYTEACGILNFIMIGLQLFVATDSPRASITWRTRRAEDSRGKHNEEWETISLSGNNLSFYSRLWWANWLMLNPRRIGTNVQAANVTPLPPYLSSVGSFCRSRVVSAAKGLVILLCIATAPSHFRFALEAVMTSSPTILQRVALTVCGVVGSWNILNATHCPLACVAVGLRVSEPEDWPDLLGAVSDAYTLRRAWGRSWHQVLRKPFEFAGNFVAAFVGAKPHTFASKYLKLYSAFALSTLVHVGGDIALQRNLLPFKVGSGNKTTTLSLEGLFSPQFFMSQAVGIMLEDHIIDAIPLIWNWGKDESERGILPPAVVRFGRIVGYTWVFMWLCATYPQVQNGVLRWSFMDLTSSM